MNKQEKQTKTHIHRQQCGGSRGKEDKIVKGNGGQIQGDRRFDFVWWAHNALIR